MAASIIMVNGDNPGTKSPGDSLYKLDPENTAWQRDLSVSYNKLGDTLRAEGDLCGSIEKYRASLAALLRTRGKSGARVDHKSVRVDAWLIVWARVLAMGFGALIERLLT